MDTNKPAYQIGARLNMVSVMNSNNVRRSPAVSARKSSMFTEIIMRCIYGNNKYLREIKRTTGDKKQHSQPRNVQFCQLTGADIRHVSHNNSIQVNPLLLLLKERVLLHIPQPPGIIILLLERFFEVQNKVSGRLEAQLCYATPETLTLALTAPRQIIKCS